MPVKRSAFKSKRKAPRARKSKRRGAKRNGGFRIRRRVPMMALQPSQITAGSFTSSNDLVLKLGTPVAAQTLAVGYWDVPFAVELRLSSLDSSADLTSIADKYKINSASFTFITNPGTYFGGGALPYIQFVSDYDDSVPPTLSALNQKMGLTTRTFNNIGMTRIRVSPKPVTTLNSATGNLSAVIPAVAPFIDCAAPDVPHYGLKGVFRSLYSPGTSAAVQNIALDIIMDVSVRDLQ